MADELPEIVDYSTLGRPLQELLEGCVVRFPSKFIGRGELCSAPADTIKDLDAMPGVLKSPWDAELADATLFVPRNLWTMGQRPTTLHSLEPDTYEVTPSGLKLKDYQRRSVTFLRNVGELDQGAILGADAGTGKSITVLQALWLDGYLQKPGLIIGPLGAQGVWCGPSSDATKHYGLVVRPLEGSTPDMALLKQGGWFFIHYEIVRAWQSWLSMHLQPVALVIDECHMALNCQGKRWESLLSVSSMRHTKRRYGLTGTPVPKSRLDLYGQLAFVQPGQWGNKHYDFGVRWSGGRRTTHEEGKGHWVFDAQTNTDELRARLAGVYLRYSKMDVAHDLPKLVRHRLEIQLPPEVWKEYREARNTIVKYREARGLNQKVEKVSFGGVEIDVSDASEKKNKALQLITTTTLKSILDRGKVSLAFDTIVDVFSQHRRLVVFTWKRDSAKLLHEKLTAYYASTSTVVYGPIDGSSKCPWPKRRETAAAFAAEESSILVATRGSVGIAINDLSAADACIQITPDWNPDGNLQAESRLHREGATALEIHSYYMLAKGTLDDRILELLDTKSREAAALAKTDSAGMHLALDLDPTIGDDSWSIDEICNMIGEIEEW